jgi:Subtilisin inhibitor-like
MTRFRRFAATVAAAAALSGAAAVAATPAEAAPARPTMLLLTVTQGETATTADSSATLYCNPTGGTHPLAAQVCAALTVTDGAPRAMDANTEQLMCPFIYQPVTVTAFGLVNGRFVDFQQTYGNACTMRSATGLLFQF